MTEYWRGHYQWAVADGSRPDAQLDSSLPANRLPHYVARRWLPKILHTYAAAPSRSS